MKREREGILLLEDGGVFRGTAVTPGTRFGEVVFNTSMTGYQEVLTDPSYRGQIVVMTQPHIGNYGVSGSAAESERPWVEGFVARQFTRLASSHSSEGGVVDYLGEHQLPALEGVDTRAIVRRLRAHGALRGVISDELGDLEGLRARLLESPSMEGRALVDEVTRRQPTTIEPVGQARCHLAVYDFGTKTNILRELSSRGARLTVLPAQTTARQVEDLGVDGVVLSNGPGDPAALTAVIAEVRGLLNSGRPLLGICLGHQLLALALGARTFKLKFGHHGGNQPVLDRRDSKVLITSQNHGFAVDPDSLPSGCEVTQENLNDGTVEAFAVQQRPVEAIQYHPEAAPGPHDAAPIFDRFLASLDAAG